MTQTQQNLLKAYAGESQARNKYTTFAKMARKENLEWIARIFEETAENERVHAEEEFELITEAVKSGAELEIGPFSKSTVENLKMAAIGEKYEWTSMYPDFEKIAKEEGEVEPERLFGKLKEVEKLHEERFIIIARKLDSKTLYDSETEMEWKCVNCGYTFFGKKPPITCPLCKKPYTWYEPVGLVK
ncbi:MAG: rubrerythrin [Candidatus Shapirobacteria bacterium GW2011_GWE1_38_10]|uniref:Rubrerythrin n=1 Tax=Candidatus Shapirobacteria bacterium GW2011_GWE1_38_10 TaxID=1618488 RepID=A0A0G0I2B0_9BACT|nr:MAG: rubrerythrin [Candidatus Shapirobacteria bacterium GW2011_GWF2_37_20]KKQ48692.1 MAG: rubrerythrin [Candidatus Shapirobacteria bacterium GW2011_GWE1_38_10]KKQ62676.1 MAG: rubrerythrin [Candidatus Shapirobacteria bacterium GW2011_GWF1_38_23]HBP50835.1 rubrerythrin family protein [Candidatus Shapirobacteria bacterium]